MPRSLRFLATLPFALAATACTTRTASRESLARTVEAPRAGFVHFGTGVRLRTDTPPLAEVLPPAASGSTPSIGDAGPRGTSGPGSDPWASSVGSPDYDLGTLGYAPYLLPGGAVLPGYRPPSDERATSPFAAPYRASFPGADVTAHRPGLSTGSGFWGRQDDGPKPK